MIVSLHHAKGTGLREGLAGPEIEAAVRAGDGCLWLDLFAERPESALAQLAAEPAAPPGPERPASNEDDLPLSLLRDVFGFHDLAVEDALVRGHLPKLDDYETYLFGIVHAPRRERGRLVTRTVSFFLGKHFLVTFHKVPHPPLEAALERVRRDPARTIAHGPDRLLHGVIDALVDAFEPVADEISVAIEGLEAEALRARGEETLVKILRTKREIASLARVLRPQRDLVGALSRQESAFVTKRERLYFRDAYDHLVRLHDLLENLRDALASARDAYLAVQSNRMNRVMQTLAAAATVLLPLTVVTGIYGMNFENMPELRWRFGYVFALLLLAAIGGGTYLWFRRRRWL